MFVCISACLRTGQDVILRTLMELMHSVPLWRNFYPSGAVTWMVPDKCATFTHTHTPYFWFIPNDLKSRAHQQHCIHPPCALRLHPRLAPSSSQSSIQASLSPSSLSCSMPAFHWD